MKNNNKKLGLVFGAGIGLCIGILTNNIAIGLSLGAGAGSVLGITLGTSVKIENEK
jgi:F0F1-type ATP synthase membrane subunit c/vacuolar-type H+-ATPase subunit K